MTSTFELLSAIRFCTEGGNSSIVAMGSDHIASKIEAGVENEIILNWKEGIGITEALMEASLGSFAVRRRAFDIPDTSKATLTVASVVAARLFPLLLLLLLL